MTGYDPLQELTLTPALSEMTDAALGDERCEGCDNDAAFGFHKNFFEIALNRFFGNRVAGAAGWQRWSKRGL